MASAAGVSTAGMASSSLVGFPLAKANNSRSWDHFLRLRQLPEDHRLSHVGRQGTATLRSEDDRLHPGLVPVEAFNPLAALHIPEAHALVHSAGEDAPAVR